MRYRDLQFMHKAGSLTGPIQKLDSDPLNNLGRHCSLPANSLGCGADNCDNRFEVVSLFRDGMGRAWYGVKCPHMLAGVRLLRLDQMGNLY